MSIKTVMDKILISNETIEHVKELRNNYLYSKVGHVILNNVVPIGAYVLSEAMKNSSNFLSKPASILSTIVHIPYLFKAINSGVNSAVDIYNGNYTQALKDGGLTALYTGIFFLGKIDPRIAIAAGVIESAHEIIIKTSVYNEIIDHIDITGETSFAMDY